MDARGGEAPRALDEYRPRTGDALKRSGRRVRGSRLTTKGEKTTSPDPPWIPPKGWSAIDNVFSPIALNP